MKADTLEKVSFFVVVFICHVMLRVYNQILRWLTAGSFAAKGACALVVKKNCG